MKHILTFLLLGFCTLGIAQEFEVSAELKPRFEYRNGFKTLVAEGDDPAAFVSQRTRLNLNYSSEKFQTYISVQNARVWGDITTLALSDKNGTKVHQAWAKLNLSEKFTLKVGRQEIAYDDQRIFGANDWAQQARSHDAFLAIYKPNDRNRIDVGLALSANSETIFEEDYEVNNYKNLQYVWYHLNTSNFGISLLLLNQGLTYDDMNSEQQVDYNQTIGTRVTYGKHKLKADASLYFQTGKIAKANLSAHNFAANVSLGVGADFNVGLGAEYMSGTDMNTTGTDLKSFTPWYGTNHKFNGWMDYFYVGNHRNSVGLLDINATLAYNKDKFSAKLVPHIFSSTANVADSSGKIYSDGLGTEIDLVLTYNWIKSVAFQAGYSQMFATETMEVLKGGDSSKTNNWAWAMIIIKPSLFKTNFKKD
ncbi:MAG: alginate export family protein [Flavobacteriaceae bacterium]|nr:alginate export family protein [Flavobacteriaceae bacterium]